MAEQQVGIVGETPARIEAEAGARVGDFVALLKPRVMSLVVFTGFAGLFVAPGHIHPVIAAVAVLCIAVAAGASGAINMWYDRDIDAVMSRTRNRPIPRGAVTPEQALAFGLVLSAFSVMLMDIAVNTTAAALLAFTIFFYVVVYTIWLKRSTPQNIVIGGASGAFPPMIGWAAVTGDVSLASISLFLIIFMWTPPHFWALSLYKEGDYAKAGVPMMPVVAGQRSTKLQMLVYTLILCPLTLVPVYFGVAGWIYGAASIALNLGFVGHAIRVLRSDDLRNAKRMFGFSLLYLFLHFALLCVDRAPGVMPAILSVLS
ncbi:heme o synthase [Dongia sedimenti]|uniref:Protoheme IX farnesyltransferase n=1 Tax=Dongia sedimenti TaxID=3064282 RepID=A0ABU0YIH3_9PROT|nr:heme o synthase [Rhodospirillaceae bacterium R-7]